MVGKCCIVRTCSAGVHYGIVEYIAGTEVLLKNARRIWRCISASTINEISKFGADKIGTRISITVKEILLTQAIEIILVTKEALKILDEIHEQN